MRTVKPDESEDERTKLHPASFLVNRLLILRAQLTITEGQAPEASVQALPLATLAAMKVWKSLAAILGEFPLKICALMNPVPRLAVNRICVLAVAVTAKTPRASKARGTVLRKEPQVCRVIRPKGGHLGRRP